MLVMSKCPVHGAFPSRHYAIDGAMNVSLQGNYEPCPQCGARSAVMEGTFNFRDGVVEVLAAPAWTREMLAGTQAAVRAAADAVSRSTSDQEILQAIDALRRDNAQLSDLVRRSVEGRPKHHIVAFLAAIVVVLGGMSDIAGGITTTVDAFHFTSEQVGKIVELVKDQLDAPQDKQPGNGRRKG
jgi:hypothetical protein